MIFSDGGARGARVSQLDVRVGGVGSALLDPEEEAESMDGEDEE
jgi:hypothetical protein